MKRFRLQRALLMASVAGLTAWSGSLLAQADQSASTAASTPTAGSEEARNFIQQAAQINDREAAQAEVGVRKAQNPDLKAFAQQMQQEHLQANEQLKPLAQKYGVTLEQPEMHQQGKELSKLEKTSGTKFDQTFATDMLRGHQQAITKYQNAATQLQSPDVRQYAQNMLPQLQQHFQHAESLAKEVGVDQTTITSIANQLPAGVGGTGEAPSPGLQGRGSSTQPGLDSQTEKGAGARQLQPDAPGPKPGQPSNP